MPRCQPTAHRHTRASARAVSMLAYLARSGGRTRGAAIGTVPRSRSDDAHCGHGLASAALRESVALVSTRMAARRLGTDRVLELGESCNKTGHGWHAADGACEWPGPLLCSTAFVEAVPDLFLLMRRADTDGNGDLNEPLPEWRLRPVRELARRCSPMPRTSGPRTSSSCIDDARVRTSSHGQNSGSNFSAERTRRPSDRCRRTWLRPASRGLGCCSRKPSRRSRRLLHALVDTVSFSRWPASGWLRATRDGRPRGTRSSMVSRPQARQFSPRGQPAGSIIA